MTTNAADHDELAELKNRLLVVYAGALPAGVLRAVIARADRMVPAQPRRRGDHRQGVPLPHPREAAARSGRTGPTTDDCARRIYPRERRVAC